MTRRSDSLAAASVFQSLDGDQLALVDAVLDDSSWEPGEEIYRAGDPADALHIVRQGAVELLSEIGGVERVFMTAREGHTFGLLSVVDGGARTGNARAKLATKALSLSYEALDELLDKHQKTGLEVLRNAGRILGQRVRMLTDQYRDTLAWNLEVTGLASLDLDRLMTEKVEVRVETLRGEPSCGTLVRFEHSVAGFELYLLNEKNEIEIIPYHALVRIATVGGAVQPDSTPASGKD